MENGTISYAQGERQSCKGYLFTPPNGPQTKGFLKAANVSDDCDNGGSGSSGAARPFDPNEFLGPGGFGAQNFVAAASLLPYRINFENYSNATAPAQFVTVQNVLATNLDLAAFELSSVGFGDRFFAVPAGSQHYERTEAMTVSGYRFQVQIEAGVNLATRTVYAYFKSLNPTNGLPPPVEIGFLPPENGTGRGMGHLAYTVRSKTGLPTGTEIRNVASIVFDQQPAIGTDWKDPHNAGAGIDTNKQALVTIDADLPSSRMTLLPATVSSGSFEVAWGGQDVGSGIGSYDVYYREDKGPWQVWLRGATGNSAVFKGAGNHLYGFYSVGIDNSGNRENKPAQAETETKVVGGNNPPTLAVINDQTIDEGVLWTLPVIATDPDVPNNLLASELLQAPQGMEIGSATGVIIWTPTEAQGPSTNVVTVKVTDDGVPPMSATNSFTIVVSEVNSAPTLPLLTNLVINELTTMVVTNTATDADLPPNTLAYALLSSPTGMVIDTNGIITWTPTEAQGPSTNTVLVSVTDNGVSLLSATNGIQIVVLEVNSAPTLSAIPDQTVGVGGSLNLAMAATDADIPTNALAFTLTSASAGMNIDRTSGVITWIPGQGQRPSTNAVTVVVTDNGVPLLSDSRSFTVIALAPNTPPVLIVPIDQVVNELTPLVLTNHVGNADIPSKTLTFSLVSGPVGMTIDTNTGVMVWTPTEAQGPSTNTVVVSVTDNGLPPWSATNSFTIVVNEVNSAPVLPVRTNLVINELTALVVTNTATDSDLPPNALAYALLSAPTGMLIDTNGIIAWTPTETQGPSTNMVLVTVTDNGVPPLSATNSYQIVVLEVNSAPTLSAIPDQTIGVGGSLNLAITATDADIPANALAFSLTSAPAGMNIDRTSGTITWTPGQGQRPSTNAVTVMVTDNGAPPLSDSRSFKVIALAPNTPPLLIVPTDQVVNELIPLVLTNYASGADISTKMPTFSLISGPVGMTINTNTGAMAWTPTEAQGPSTNVVFVRVADNGVPPMSATNSFTIVVNEVNSAPVLPVQKNLVINELTPLVVTNTATDADLPPNALAYALLSAPTGMVIDTNGIITWTPTEEQGPSTNTVLVSVTDNGVPPLSVTNSLQIVVLEVNSTPTLSAIADQTIGVSGSLILAITATDADIPANALAFTLTSAPVGMKIDRTSGVMTWTPGTGQIQSTNAVTVMVTDNGVPPLSDSRSFKVIALAPNTPPVLIVPTNQVVNELTRLVLTNYVSNAVIPAKMLTFSLVSGPVGMTIGTNTGVMVWTLTEAQGPSTNVVVVSVTDNGVPPLSTTNHFEIVVREVNSAPILTTSPREYTVYAGDKLVFTNSSADADLPTNTLVFLLDMDAPVGAELDRLTGVFTWVTPRTITAATNQFTIWVTDTGAPMLSDAKKFVIAALPKGDAPRFTSIKWETSGQLTLAWASIPGTRYQLQYKTDLREPDWKSAGGVVSANGENTVLTDQPGTDPRRYYRVMKVDN